MFGSRVLLRSLRSQSLRQFSSGSSSSSSSSGIPFEFRVFGGVLTVAGGTVLYLSYRRDICIHQAPSVRAASLLCGLGVFSYAQSQGRRYLACNEILKKRGTAASTRAQQGREHVSSQIRIAARLMRADGLASCRGASSQLARDDVPTPRLAVCRETQPKFQRPSVRGSLHGASDLDRAVRAAENIARAARFGVRWCCVTALTPTRTCTRPVPSLLSRRTSDPYRFAPLLQPRPCRCGTWQSRRSSLCTTTKNLTDLLPGRTFWILQAHSQRSGRTASPRSGRWTSPRPRRASLRFISQRTSTRARHAPSLPTFPRRHCRLLCLADPQGGQP